MANKKRTIEDVWEQARYYSNRYYWKNRDEVLKRARDKYNNDKENSYYYRHREEILAKRKAAYQAKKEAEAAEEEVNE